MKWNEERSFDVKNWINIITSNKAYNLANVLFSYHEYNKILFFLFRCFRTLHATMAIWLLAVPSSYRFFFWFFFFSLVLWSMRTLYRTSSTYISETLNIQTNWMRFLIWWLFKNRKSIYGMCNTTHTPWQFRNIVTYIIYVTVSQS